MLAGVLNLLGIHADERLGCGLVVTDETPGDSQSRELLALRKRKDEVAGLDALDRVDGRG